jgi:AAA15 family ATPase/GTPase
LEPTTLSVGGKNVFIYGENGSGKSSLYYALKDFFQSSIETIDLAQLENSFVKPETQGKVAIKVTFKPNGNGQNQAQAYLFDTSQNDTRTRLKPIVH